MPSSADRLDSRLNRVLDRFACPACLHGPGAERSSLVEESGALQCSSCRQRFPIRHGVPDLRPDAGKETSSSLEAVEFYERVYTEQIYGRDDQSEHRASLEDALKALDSDSLVVELGTGKGALQGVHPGYVGTDISLEGLLAHIRTPSFVSDAMALPLSSQSVDYLFTVATLEHVNRPERALAEISRVIRPGGIAYLAPAWNCRTWASEGLHVRPYRDLTVPQRLRKATIPIRNSVVWRGAFAIPKRTLRRLWCKLRRRPADFRYRRLNPNYEVFWASDSDATAQMDPHEAALYFESHGWEIVSPADVLGRIFHRHQPLIVRRPESARVPS